MISDQLLQALHFAGHAATAVITAVLAYWVFTRTELSSKRWFVVWMGNFSVWSAVSAAVVVVSHQPTAYVLFLLWALVGLTAIYLTVIFPTAYTGRNPMTNTICQLSTVIYAVLAALVVTGPFHDLYWRSVSFPQSPFPHFTVEYGPGWLTAVLFSLLTVSVLLYYFAELYFRSRRRQRRVAVILAVGGVFSVIPVVLSHNDLLLVPSYDYYAFTGTTQALVVGYAALRFGPETLSVVAREEALDTLVDPYIALDTQYRVVDFNDASSSLIEELTIDRLGASLEALAPELASTVTGSTGLDVPDDPITFMVEGRPHHYSVAVSPVSDWNTTKGYAVVLNDVTELANSRQRIRQQNEQLDAFVGTVSHDLRSPLSVIAGRLQLAQTDCDSEHLDHIQRAHSRMDELIDDLLTLAREGDDVGEWEPVDVGALADRCWLTVDTKAATLQTETERTVLADRGRLRQLLENLLRNSVEHGSEDVTITVGALETGFYLEDDGPGIPEADREVVFETGYTTGDDGTGFGLAIVSQIVEAHGWEIRVTAGSAGGARFEITGVDVVE